MPHEAEIDERLRRLERRLQRERAARLEAELIAERGIRELYEQEKRAQLVKAVAAAANISLSVEEAFHETLTHLCRFTGWPVGHAYLVDEEEGLRTPRSSRVWVIDGDVDCPDFVEASEAAVFTSGVGLPGRALASGKAIWAPDVTEDRNFPRLLHARRCGLHAAFAFPVLASDEVVAVIEFFCGRIIQDPDAILLATVEQIGAQLGRIIERSRAEQQLNARNAELGRLIEDADAQRKAAEAASRAKSTFLAVTSHEIRTPLNAVLGLAEALSREPLTPAQADLAHGVLDAGAMLLRLLNAVLNLSKIESGKMTLEVAPFDLRSVAKTILGVWGPKAGETNVRLGLEIENLPDPCLVMSDVAKIEQTLVNLLSNALKFSPEGGRVTLRLAGHPASDRFRLRAEVLDDGPGVSEADRERVFKPFEQSEAGRLAGGTGLGLSICAGNVELLGGAIGVDRTGEGRSRFWFEIPAAPAQAPQTPSPAPEVEFAGAERPLRILAAEDNAANRKVLSLLLGQFEVSLTLVEDGEAAVEAVRTEAFDLVLMDVNMPVMDGIAALKAIRALGPYERLPIHMLTANVFDDDVARYLAAGADGVLQKPIDLKALAMVLNDVAEKAPLISATA